MAFNPTRGPARHELLHETAKALEAKGALVHDDRRLRSFFFDGRYFAAKDLTREQTYFLQRQADLCRAGGIGVVSGLRVMAGSQGDPPGTLRITRGHGVTPSGEIVVLPHDVVSMRLDDIPEMERLDAAFGLSRIPRETARKRTGLYVLALRPVEYTANPIASYPTTLGGSRSAHDGDIIEAVAVTLIPFHEPANKGAPSLRRARAAHEIFVRGTPPRAPADALPIAVLALDHGILQWVDEFLVRREIGSEQTDFLGFGYAPQALREAHLLQYKQHLAEILREHKGERFAASDHFLALPAAGPLPLSAIDPAAFTELYFPAEVDVELSVIPEDELAALIEESLFLPPIDLTLPGEELASTSVMVLVPVPRRKLEEALAFLFPTQRSTPIKLRSAAPGMVSRRLPGEALSALTTKWSAAVPAKTGQKLADAAWSKVLALGGGNAGLLWYARRKSFPYKPAIIGVRVPEIDDELPNLRTFLEETTLVDEFASLGSRATIRAIHQIYTSLNDGLLLGESGQPLYPRELVAVFAGEVLRLEHVDLPAVEKMRPIYIYDKIGEGIAALKANTDFAAIPLSDFARAGVSVVDLDKLVIGQPSGVKASIAAYIVDALQKGQSFAAAIAAALKVNWTS